MRRSARTASLAVAALALAAAGVAAFKQEDFKVSEIARGAMPVRCVGGAAGAAATAGGGRIARPPRSPPRRPAIGRRCPHATEAGNASVPPGRKRSRRLASPPPPRSRRPPPPQKCADAPFCAAHRVAPGPGHAIDPDTLKVDGHRVTAELVEAGGENRLSLELAAHAGGALRVRVTEPGVARFEPPGVVRDDVGAWTEAWGQPAVSRGVAALAAAAPGGPRARLAFNPFQLDLLPPAGSGDAPIATLNGAGGFLMQARRGRGDNATDDVWKSHRDTAPHGPQAVAFDLAFPGAAFVAGLPERATSLALKPTLAADASPLSEPYRLYNLDVFEYEAESPFGLYGSIPMVMAHAPAGAGGNGGGKGGKNAPPVTTVGALWVNAAEMYVDVVARPAPGAPLHTRWLAESGILDLWLFSGPTPADVAAAHARVTGTTAMPQRFALGYHQCRWNYRDDADARAVDAGFDAHDIPYDVLWLDIEHTDGKRYMTWDADLFPEPAKLIGDIASRGRKVVAIVDPHVKRDDGYRIYADAKKAGHFVKDREGNEFDGWCWPGASSYLDVLSAAVRDWWAAQFALDKYAGSTPDLHIWNDMNEPSVFNGWEKREGKADRTPARPRPQPTPTPTPAPTPTNRQPRNHDAQGRQARGRRRAPGRA